jgi:hypothetical protein
MPLGSAVACPATPSARHGLGPAQPAYAPNRRSWPQGQGAGNRHHEPAPAVLPLARDADQHALANTLVLQAKTLPIKPAPAGFKDISPAYLTPADGRTAFIGNSVDAWVAWDPFLSSTLKQSEVRVLADGSNGLASYKRYYLASAAYADAHGDALNVIFNKLSETGKWVKTHSAEAAGALTGLWGMDAATIEEANSHRSYLVGPVTALSLSEQQRIADAFFAEHLIPAKLDTAALKIWTPKGP